MNEIISNLANLLFPILNTAVAFTVPYVFYLYKYKIPKYELKRGRLVKNPRTIKLPPEIKQKARAMTTRELYNELENEAVINFKNRLDETLDDKHRIIMNNNLRSLDIKVTLNSRLQKLLLANGINPYRPKKSIKSGSYNFKKNSIVIRDTRTKTTIYHELMHMASTVRTNEIAYVGFKQRMNGESIGQGINEGYTQHLTEKLFPEYKSTRTISYPFETHFASLVEDIVTEDTMIDLFFRADLRSLMIELSKYSSISETGKFIRQLDVLNKYKYSDFLFVKVHPELQEIIYDLNYYLLLTYKNKLKQTKGLTPKEKEIKLIKFISKIESGYIYTNKNYYAFPEKAYRRA